MKKKFLFMITTFLSLAVISCKKEKKVDKSAPTSAITISTDIVNVEAVVYNKKTGQIITGLKKENFAVFERNETGEIGFRILAGGGLGTVPMR